jgi:anti-sigma factor RsiW
LRQRWFGATGRRVPEIAVEGDPAVPVEEALVLDDVSDRDALRAAHEVGKPVVVRARDAAAVKAALARPEVASVLVPTEAQELVELDLRDLTYGD